MKIAPLITILLISACSNKGMYEALRQNECLKNERVIYCDDGRDYDEYMRERDKLLKDKKEKKSAKAQEDFPNLFH